MKKVIFIVWLMILSLLLLPSCYGGAYHSESEIGSIDNPAYIHVYDIDFAIGESVNLSNPNINGTVTTNTGFTLPDFTSGEIIFNTNDGFSRDDDSHEININGGSQSGGGHGSSLRLFGSNEARNGAIHFSTPNNAESGTVNRLEIGGSGGTGSDWAIADWYLTYTTGLMLEERLDMRENYIRFDEMTPPGASTTDHARLYVFEGAGDNLTDSAFVYQDGTVDIFSQETTPLDSPIFRYPDDTEIKYTMKKPHSGIIQFVAEYPDGSYFVIKELNYHLDEKINANSGAKMDDLPDDWIVLTKDDLNKISNSENITIK